MRYTFRNIIYAVQATVIILLCAACSTTSNLPEGEILYAGIKTISYDAPQYTRIDSTGVITAVANAVNVVGDLLSGSGDASLSDLVALDPESQETARREAQKRLKAEAEVNAAALAAVKSEVEAVLAYPPNGSILGSSTVVSPIKFGLSIYNAFSDSKTKVGKWILKNFGTAPKLISTVAPDTRVKVATNALRNYGFFGGKVTYKLEQGRNPNKAKLSYNVVTGKVSCLDSIAYIGFAPEVMRLVNPTGTETLLKRGAPFSVLKLTEEQNRIEQILRENGYYYYTAPSTTFEADTLLLPGKVQLHVLPSDNLAPQATHPWHIGETFITMYDQFDSPLDTTRKRRGYTYTYHGETMPLRVGMWRRAISHRKGKLYTLSDQKATLEKLSAIGVLSSIDVNYVPRDSSALCDTLDVYVTAKMDKLYDSSFEMNATMKSNQQIGPGLSYELAKRNAFRGGERVAFRIYGSYEWQTGAGREGGSSLLNSYQLGAKLSFEFPRFVFPGISRRQLRFPASTVLSLDADWTKRSSFFSLVTMGVSAKYQWHKSANLQHELTLFGLDFSKMLKTTPVFDEMLADNPVLAVAMSDQFVPYIHYSLTYTTRQNLRHAFWMQFSAKESGNLTSGIYAATGRKWSETGKTIMGSPFAQYVRFTAELHHTLTFTPDIKLASRFFGGIVASYGNVTQAPYSDQFYVGGANSIRAFTVRTIGPGHYRSQSSRYAYIDQTGDIKLELNTELRARLVGSLFGAIFLDAGNVWLLRKDPSRPGAEFSGENLKHIAVGTGAGLRYDIGFLVLRFDLGVALHAPYETGKSGFYNIPKFGDGLALHFAIGYPF